MDVTDNNSCRKKLKVSPEEAIANQLLEIKKNSGLPLFQKSGNQTRELGCSDKSLITAIKVNPRATINCTLC